MINRSFKNFLNKEPDNPDLYPYVYSIKFKGLTEASQKQYKVQPIKCSECGAIITNLKALEKRKEMGYFFKCDFCGTVNNISGNIPFDSLPNDVEFIIEDIESSKRKPDSDITKVKSTEGELYISIIDISGSMSGPKIEAVKNSLVQTIKDFKINSPTTKFLLIAFESSVYYYLRHDENPLKFGGDVLFSLEQMRAKLDQVISGDTFIGSIGEFADKWTEVVKNLRSMDMTALGPALYFGIMTYELLEQYDSGRITLLTDGLANQGVGNLSGTSINAQMFYENMAHICNKNNIIIDVVGVSSVSDSSEMGLQILGRLTDSTGGNLYLISEDEMKEVFSQLQKRKYVGKDVKIKIVTPQEIDIKNVTGAFSSKDVKSRDMKLGAITADRELYVELKAPKKAVEKKEEIPIQIQVEYKDNEGRKKLRVINDFVEVTGDEKDFKATYNQKLNAMMNIQAAGSEYYRGETTLSKARLKNLKENMMTEAEKLKSIGITSQNSFSEGAKYIDDELEEIEMEEEEAKAAPQESFKAVKGQMRARMSQEVKEANINKKKSK